MTTTHNAHVYYLHTLSATHFGTGQSLGVIDQTIAREAATGFPVGPGSSVKGSLRDEMFGRTMGGEKIDLAYWFGPDADEEEDDRRKGALNVGDARLLCLPVRSLCGGVAWITCPMVLQRYRRDLLDAGLPSPDAPCPLDDVGHARCAGSALLFGSDKNSAQGRLYLEDLDLTNLPDLSAGRWAEWIAKHALSGEPAMQECFKARFVLIHDSVFGFLASSALEIRARNRLDRETRNVKFGPWYEEHLPAETLLWGHLARERAGRDPNDLSDLLNVISLPCRIQVGAGYTVGQGQVYLRVHGYVACEPDAPDDAGCVA